MTTASIYVRWEQKSSAYNIILLYTHIQNDAPYVCNETESWTGLFTSMECSSVRRALDCWGVCVCVFASLREYYAARTKPAILMDKTTCYVCYASLWAAVNWSRFMYSYFFLGSRERGLPTIRKITSVSVYYNEINLSVLLGICRCATVSKTITKTRSRVF